MFKCPDPAHLKPEARETKSPRSLPHSRRTDHPAATAVDITRFDGLQGNKAHDEPVSSQPIIYTCVGGRDGVCNQGTRPSKRELQKLLAMERHKKGEGGLVRETLGVPREGTGQLPKTDGTG